MQVFHWANFRWKIEQFKWEFWNLWRTYILHQQDCDNCYYFGGCCCDHLDDNGNCLGWERANLNPIHRWRYHHMVKKAVRIMKKYNI